MSSRPRWDARWPLTTAWGLLYDGELTAEQFVDCGVGVLTRETADSVIEPLLGRLVDAADHWAPPAARDRLLSRVGDLCLSLADDPGRRLAALRGLAQSATTPAQLRPWRATPPSRICGGAGSCGWPSWISSTSPTSSRCSPRTPTRTPG